MCVVCVRAAHPCRAGGVGLREVTLRTGPVFGVRRSVVSVRAYSADGLAKGRRAVFFCVEFAPRPRRQPLPGPVPKKCFFFTVFKSSNWLSHLCSLNLLPGGR
jgi:hypothetical protein